MKNKDNIYRCDLLPNRMNAGKEFLVRDLFKAWRDIAKLISKEQIVLFFTTGRFNKMFKSPAGKSILPAAHIQMVRHQVVGILDSYKSNLQNAFTYIVNYSALPSEVKHQLHYINRWSAWYSPEPVEMKDGVVPHGTRKLARKIMGHLLKCYRWPGMDRINMIIDQRGIAFTKAQDSAFPYWIRLSTLQKGKPIWIPVQSYPYFEARTSGKAKTIQANMDRDGVIRFGILSDVSDEIKKSRAKYHPLCEEMSLDLGLKTLFATDQGALLGRGWFDVLKTYDSKISSLAAYRQKNGLKVRSPRYNRHAQQLRGFIRSEVNRILNHLIDTRRPARLIVERLNFRHPELSKRLNRLIQNFGKKAVADKLNDLKEKFGIEVEERNPAYSSQECCICGYVDKRNRPSQEAFKCLWCGSTRHADGNAAVVLKVRRSHPELSSPWRRKADILGELVRRFTERYTRLRGGPADPRLSNSCFKEWAASVT